MPPKRAAPSDTDGAPAAASGSAPTPKRVASGDGQTKPKPSRYAKAGISKNLAAEYAHEKTRKAKLGHFVCMCGTPFPVDYYPPDPDAEPVPPGQRPKRPTKPPCDGGKKSCLCNHPASENPNHRWVITAAGKWKFFQQRHNTWLREPDTYAMHTTNDHGCYGVLEVLQNLLVDFVEAEEEDGEDGWHERWAVVEATTFYMKTDFVYELTMIDDSELADATYRLLGRMFLRMLTFLESKFWLGPPDASPIKNLGLMMALMIDVAGYARRNLSILEKSEKEPIFPPEDNKFWFPHKFEDQIFAYVLKYNIPLVGLKDAEKYANGQVDLPVFRDDDPSGTEDAFEFYKDYTAYVNKYAGVTAFLSKREEAAPKGIIGGDALDCSSWTSAERIKYSLRGKDHFSAKQVKAIKKGEVV
ncbi:hypothetical protein V8F20_009841 [Naviculisporaceae sp. PSN 640]